MLSLLQLLYVHNFRLRYSVFVFFLFYRLHFINFKISYLLTFLHHYVFRVCQGLCNICFSNNISWTFSVFSSSLSPKTLTLFFWSTIHLFLSCNANLDFLKSKVFPTVIGLKIMHLSKYSRLTEKTQKMYLHNTYNSLQLPAELLS